MKKSANKNRIQIPDMTEEELILILSKYAVPYTSWGTGNAKTLAHLLKEINIGEAKLEETQDGSKTLKLFEEKQVYKNGRVITAQLF